MQHNLLIIKNRWPNLILTLAVAAVLSFGCSSAPTPAPAPEPQVANRGWSEHVIYYPNCGVAHPALYMQDPFEHYGSNDGWFRTWCFDDFVAAMASPPIFVGNIVALPVAAVVAPPWQQQISRGGYPVQGPAYELPGEPVGTAANDVEYVK